MKLSEFSKPAPPASPGVSPSSPQEPPVASQEAPQEEQYFTSITPSGIEVAYSPAPRRHYKLRLGGAAPEVGPPFVGDEREWIEVPSVTTVLGVLDKSGPLTWWGQGIGAEGVIKLLEKRALITHPVSMMDEYGGEYDALVTPEGHAVDKADLVDLLVKHRLSVNHVKDSTADRGVNVHGALEAWVKDGSLPIPADWPEHERGYVNGLASFLDFDQAVVRDVQSELMVGSLEHSYAGRFDLVLTLSKPVEVVTKAYPKRPPKIEEIPAGRYLLDLKTRKKAAVYDSNYLQLEAYEAAAVECGYEPTDYRGVIVVTEDGKYQLSINRDWTFQDFLAVRRCFAVMNERGVVQALRDELDATERSSKEVA